MLALHLGGVAGDLVAQMERRVARALRVILVRDRRAEQRHDAVAGVLVDRAFEAVHAVGEDREEALEDAVPRFRIELLGQLHRALHVGEEHGDLLALAFERGLRLEDLVGEVFRGVRARVAFRRRDAARRRCRGPCERVLLAPGDALHVDQLLDDLLERVVVQLELSPQHPQGQAAVLFEVMPHLANDVEEIHGGEFASSASFTSPPAHAEWPTLSGTQRL